MSTPEPYNLKPVHCTSGVENQDRELSATNAALAFPDFDDPNFDEDEAMAGILEDDSPYPEVRSAVANTDDPDIPVSTIRAWILGLIFAIIIPGLNQFLYYRYPSVLISGASVAQLLIFPLGRLWARAMPNFKIFGAQLNPGPFSMKEHVLATIMASVAPPPAYANDIPIVQRLLYNQNYNFAYQWLLVMSTQLIGFSIGGICRRFLVDPPSMIWPTNLASSALFNTLHGQTYSGIGHRGGISRERFFIYCFAASATWFLVPGYLFQGLSYFSWVCWIAPDNIPVNEMFGSIHGMGMSLITFDWSQIAFIISPLVTPWSIEANVLAGFFFFYWFLTPLLHYTNVWSGKYMPISSSGAYDNRGRQYNVSRVLNDDATFNQQLYEAYSPLYISTAFAITYGLNFAAITATLTHVLLYFRKQIFAQSKQQDIHARLMSRYPQVPAWWYATIFLAMFAFGIAVIEGFPTGFPVQWFILALVIPFLVVIPAGMIQAVSNTQILLNVLAELVIGYGLPGRPIPMMLFKTWGYITVNRALIFVSDFKLGHYMKIPPKTMFCAQVVGTVIAGTVQLGVQTWMFSNIPDICDPSQKNGFICPYTKIFGTASILWGVIGPARLFSKGQIYYCLPVFFIVGALCPLLAYLFSLRFPKSWVRYVNFPIIFSVGYYIPIASGINYVMWGIVGFIFQYVIRRRHFSWWAKYNYVLSTALDSGVAMSTLLIFFVLVYPANGTIGLNSIQGWWGNVVFTKTADALGTPLLSVPEGSHFGPDTWH